MGGCNIESEKEADAKGGGWERESEGEREKKRERERGWEREIRAYSDLVVIRLTLVLSSDVIEEREDFWSSYVAPVVRKQQFSPDMEYKITQTETGDPFFFFCPSL